MLVDRDNMYWYDLEVMKIRQRREQQGEEDENGYAGKWDLGSGGSSIGLVNLVTPFYRVFF